MEWFKTYCTSLIVVVVCASVIMLLAPENEKIRKYVRFVTALCITASILFPIKGILGTEAKIDIPESIDGADVESKYNEVLLSEIKKRISDNITELVKNKFDTETISCEICIEIDGDNVLTLKSIDVEVNTKSKFLCGDIKNEIEKIYQCDVKCETNGG